MHLVRSLQEFVTLREQWNRLADRLRTPLLWHEWFLSAARTLYEECDLYIAVVRSGDRITAAAPLALHAAAGPRRLELMGSPVLGEPGGLLYEDGSALKELLHDLRSSGRPLVLSRLEAADPVHCLLRRSVGCAVSLVIENAPSLSLPLGGDWEGFLASRSPRLRHDLRRARRRAELLGEIEVQIAAPSPGEVDAVFERFLTVEASGWKGVEGSALLRRDALRSFFLQLCRLTAARGALRTAFIRIGGEVAAGALAIEAYGRLWVIKIGYDERFGRCSPGLLLTVETIADALSRGMAAYEFLGTAESWEERWNPVVRRHVTALVYPPTASGGLALAADVAGAAVRRIARLRRKGQVRSDRVP